MLRAAITEAESAVMAALWRRGALSPKALLEEVRKEQSWGDATIKTLLNRLMRKENIRSDRTSGVLVYVPQVSREDYLDYEVQAFVDRLFEGDRERLTLYLKDQAAVSVFDPASIAKV